MPRRRKVSVRQPEPDSVYSSRLVSRIINKILSHGKKTKAVAIVYGAMKIAGDKLSVEPLTILEEAIKNITPAVEVRSKRIGGGNYQIPMEIKPHRKQALAIRWLVQFMGERKGISSAEALAQEIMDAYNKTGASFKKKEDTHRMAEANKAYAHFARYR